MGLDPRLRLVDGCPCLVLMVPLVLAPAIYGTYKYCRTRSPIVLKMYATRTGGGGSTPAALRRDRCPREPRMHVIAPKRMWA